MADEKQLKQAQTAFDTLCAALEKHDWHYEKDVENLSIKCGAQGDDLPINVNIIIDPDRYLVILLSQLPFKTPLEKCIEIAVAVNIVNNKLIDGSFDFNIESGHMVFRMTSSFRESLIGDEVFAYMLYCSCQTIDLYNDRLMMLAKGMITLEQFSEFVLKPED